MIARGSGPWFRSHGGGRFVLLAALGLLWYLTFELTQWRAPVGAVPTPVKLFPVPEIAWYTGACMLFGAGLWSLLASSARLQAPTTDLAMRRVAIGSLALAYGFELPIRVPQAANTR